MPKIPIYDSPQIETKPLPGPYQSSVASPELFGEQARSMKEAGRGLMAAADAITDRMRKKEDEDNKAMVLSRFSETQTAILAALMDGKEKRRGEHAMGWAAEFLKEFDKMTSEVASGLKNPEQKKMYLEKAQRLRLTAWEEARRHEAEETVKFRSQSVQAVLAGAIKLGSEASSAEHARDQLDLGKAALHEHLTARGISPDSAKGKPIYDKTMLEYTTEFHSSRIRSLLSRNLVNEAKEYFDAVQGTGQIDPIAATNLRNALNDLAAKHEVSKLVDDLARQYPTAPESVLKQEIVNRVSDPARRSEALNMLRVWIGIRDDQKRERNKALTDPIYRMIGDATIKGTYINTKSKEVSAALANIAAVDPELFKLMSKAIDNHNDEIRNERRIAAAAASGTRSSESPEQVTKQDEAYYRLYREFLANPKAFAEKNLLEDKNFALLRSSDKQEIMRLQKLPPAEQRDVATLTQQIDTAWREMGYGNKEKDQQLRAKFERVVRNAVIAASAGGKRLDDEARQKIIDRLILEGKVKHSGLFRDDRGRAFEFVGTPDEKNFVPDRPMRATTLADVPMEHQRMIKEEAARRGIRVTPQEIIRKYNQLHGYE